MSQRQTFSSGSRWEPVVGYSRAVRTGNLIHVSGTVGAEADGSFSPSPARQTERCLEIIAEALGRAGAGLEKVARTRIYLADMGLFEEVGRAHGRVFGDIRPATTMIETPRLADPACVVEIEATAVLEERPAPPFSRVDMAALDREYAGLVAHASQVTGYGGTLSPLERRLYGWGILAGEGQELAARELEALVDRAGLSLDKARHALLDCARIRGQAMLSLFRPVLEARGVTAPTTLSDVLTAMDAQPSALSVREAFALELGLSWGARCWDTCCASRIARGARGGLFTLPEFERDFLAETCLAHGRIGLANFSRVLATSLPEGDHPMDIRCAC